MDKLLDIQEVSQLIGISISTLYKMTSQRRIPFVKIGRLIKFDRKKILEWIEQNSVQEESY